MKVLPMNWNSPCLAARSLDAGRSVGALAARKIAAYLANDPEIPLHFAHAMCWVGNRAGAQALESRR
jgi:hypothetical protein